MLPTILILSAGGLLLTLAAALIAGRWIVVQLTLKYLFKRRLAWIAIAAVTLCVWLVLVVYSVMGGWLRMFEDTYKTMSGDLIISRPSLKGFMGYEEIMARLRAMPEVKSAVPVVRAFGIFTLSTGYQNYAQIVGLPTDAQGDIDTQGVMQFGSSLWLQNPQSSVKRWVPDRKPSFKLWADGFDYKGYDERLPNADTFAGAIIGGNVVGVVRDKKTNVPDWNFKFGVSEVAPVPHTGPMKITVAPPDRLDDSTSIPQSARYYWIVDGSRTQLPVHDNNIYVPFDVLQRQLEMDARTYEVIDPESRTKQPLKDAQGNPITRESPAKATEIQVSLKDPARAAEMKERVQAIVNEVTGESPAVLRGSVRVQTWREAQEMMIGAIQNEIRLTTTLFAFISLVAVFMIFAIFYMIVMEKTRDIGIIKSVGATAWSIASIFLAYGAVIGVVGGGLGVLAGWLTVKYINEIHSMLGVVFGFQIWSAETYAFDLIPNKMDPTAAALVAVFAIVAAVVGAIVPAIKAALQRPVESLRFE